MEKCVRDHADKIADLNGTPDRAESFPRLRRRAKAAAYCDITPETFDDWVRKGLLPGPLPGTKRWDLKAIDLALDRLSGIESPTAAHTAFDEWKTRRNGQD